MADGVVWDEEAPPEAAPAPPAGGVVWDETPEEFEAKQDQAIGNIFRQSLRADLDRHASVLELKRQTGAPADVIDARFDDFKKSWEGAKFDVKKWRADPANKELEKLALERPDIGEVVVRDKTLNPVMKALKSFEAAEQLEVRALSLQAGIGFEEGKALDWYGPSKSSGGPLPGKSPEDLAKEGFPVSKVPMVTDASATGDTLDRVSAAFGVGAKQREYSQLGRELLGQIVRGEDTWALEKRVADMKDQLSPRYFGETGPVEQTLLDAAEMLPSMLETYKGAGLGGLAGALVGSVPGLLTRNKDLAKKGAGLGLKVGARGGAALASFDMESGGALLDMLEEKTDDGKPVGRASAAGAAIAYGLAAAGIESVTFGVELSAWGPAGDAVRNGTGKAFFKEALKNAGMRKVFADIGKRWAKGAIGESLEEFSQQVAQEVAGYAAKSVSAGKLQKADISGALERSTEALTKAFSASLALAPAQGATSGIQTLVGAKFANAQAERAAAQVPAIASLAESPTTKADPEAAAKLVAQATAQSGEAVTHMYVDPVAVMRFFQDGKLDPAQAAEELFGSEGGRMLQEAIATGSKVEVPVADFLSKWGASGAAQGLAEDITTQPGHLTPRQLREQGAEVDAQAKELAESFAKEDAAAPAGNEAAYADQLEKQLISTKRAGTAAEARTAINLHRAMIRTMAERAGVPAEQLFANLVVEVQKGELSEEGGQAALAQDPLDVEPAASQALTERADPDFGATPEERAADLFRDPVSGLRNRAAWDASPRQPGKMVAVITATDAKAINDDPTGGHDTTNSLLRSIGATVAQLDSSAARQGTNFLLHVGSEAELDAAVARIKAGLPDSKLNVEGAIGFTVDKAFKKLDSTVDAKRSKGELPARGGTAIDLSTLPDLEQRLAGDPLSAPLPADLVERAAKLSPEDFFREAYQDRDVPEILSGTGWKALPRKAFVASLDLKGLKDINADLGKEAGDQVLAFFGRVAQQMGANAFDFAHLSGDEYAAQADNQAELQLFLDDLRAQLLGTAFPFKLGDRTHLLRVQFRDGIGEKTYGAADRVLNARKRAERDLAGTAEGAAKAKSEAQARGLVDDVQRRADLEARRARAARRGTGPQGIRSRPDAGPEASLGGDAGQQLDDSFDTSAFDSEPEHTPEQIAVARAEIGRMRLPEKQAMASAWLDFTLGLTEKRPTVTDEMEKHFAEAGFVDPINGYTFDEGGRSLERGLGGKKRRGKEPAEFRRQRLANAEFRATGSDSTRYEQPAFHGSPHRFEKFELHSIGTGEGNQAYGWGLYFAGKKAIAEYYRNTLSRNVEPVFKKDGVEVSHLDALEAFFKPGRIIDGYAGRDRVVEFQRSGGDWSVKVIRVDAAGKARPGERERVHHTTPRAEEIQSALAAEGYSATKGQLYKVDVPEHQELLDYDKSLSEQPEGVRKILEQVVPELGYNDTNENFWKQTGGDFYFNAAQLFPDGPKDISEILLAKGIPGLRYLDGASRSDGEGSHNFVIWDDSRVQVEETYFAGDEKNPRGHVTFNKAGLERIAKIVLNPNADLSTFLHESGHVFLDFFGELADRPDAPAKVKEDLAAALKWLGVERREDIKREHHEKWARGFEAYLLEGKAPSQKLAAAFDAFRLWMLEIYRSISSLNVDLNEEIRGVFDRLLATDEEIQRTKKAMGLELLFRSPEEAGMTPEQWQAYLEDARQATSTAARAAELKVLKERLRVREDWWKQEERKEREAAASEYDELPASQALLYLRTGEVNLKRPDGPPIKERGAAPKLDPQAVAYALGRKPHPKLRGFLKRNGLHPDDVAELFDFPTGRAMLEALETHPERDPWVKERTAERMAEKHPDILAERDAMRALAAKGLHGEHTARWLLKEWAALRTKSGVGATPPIEAVKRAAHLIVERRAVRRLDAGGTLRAERAAAQKAAQAAAKGNFAQAAVFKQQQLLNMFIHRELTAARELRDTFEDLSAELADDKSRKRLGKANPVYREIVDMLLEAVGISDERKRDEQTTLNDLRAAMEADGETVAFDVELINKLLREPGDWRALTVAEMRGLVEALKNIRQAARNKTTALIDGKREDRDTIVAKLLTEAAQNLPAKPPVASSVAAMGPLEAIGVGASALDGSLLRPETMIRWLGKGLDSTWFRAIFKPLNDAKQRERDLLKKHGKPILDALDAVPKAIRRRMNEKIDGEALFPGHRNDIAPPSRRFELLSLALNAGNAGNKQRLLDGRGISETELQAALELLSKEEMDWVQSVGDAFESMWPAIKDLEERDTGVVPGKVDATPISTSKGTWKGFYFPAVYDRRVSTTGERQAANTIASLMDQSYSRPGTSHSHTKARARDFADVIALDLSVIQAHVVQAVHDLAFREPVKSVGGLILSPDVQAALKRHLGDGRARVFLQWVKDVGQMRGAEVITHAKGFNDLLGKLKSNMAVAVLGYAVDVVKGDLSNPLVALSATELKTKHLAAGMAEFIRSPREAIAFVAGKSGEMRFRDDAFTREFSARMKKLTKPNNVATETYNAFVEHAFTVFEWSEKVSTTGIWIGAYRQALRDPTAEEADAIQFADGVVRRVVPASSAVDKSEVLRSKGMIGGLLLFHGYMNTVYQLLRDTSHPLYLAAASGETAGEKAKNVGAVMLPTSARLLGIVVAVGLVAEFLSGKGPEADDGDDEEEKWATWATRKALFTTLNAVPFLGPIAERVSGKSPSQRAAPGFAVVDEIAKAVKKAADGDAEAWDKALATAKALGYLSGTPTARPLRAADYIHDLLTGDTEARNPADVYGGVIYGDRGGKQPANPAKLIGDAVSGE